MSSVLNSREASHTAPADVATWRKQERARLLDARKAMPLERFQAATGSIMRNVARIVRPEGVIGCYWPFRREPDCIPFMRDVLKAGAEVALPVVIARGSPLEFRLWTEASKMEAGAWDILHPAEGVPVRPSVLVVPLVGFDEAGFRLGYGAGYYDMTLASLSPRPFTVGIGFEFARLPSICPMPHDIPLDIIVTEERLRDFRKPGHANTDHEQERAKGKQP
jgi:5,10-methenyltetrahydrofolate synthetase